MKLGAPLEEPQHLPPARVGPVKSHLSPEPHQSWFTLTWAELPSPPHRPHVPCYSPVSAELWGNKEGGSKGRGEPGVTPPPSSLLKKGALSRLLGGAASVPSRAVYIPGGAGGYLPDKPASLWRRPPGWGIRGPGGRQKGGVGQSPPRRGATAAAAPAGGQGGGGGRRPPPPAAAGRHAPPCVSGSATSPPWWPPPEPPPSPSPPRVAPGPPVSPAAFPLLWRGRSSGGGLRGGVAHSRRPPPPDPRPPPPGSRNPPRGWQWPPTRPQLGAVGRVRCRGSAPPMPPPLPPARPRPPGGSAPGDPPKSRPSTSLRGAPLPRRAPSAPDPEDPSLTSCRYARCPV